LIFYVYEYFIIVEYDLIVDTVVSS